MSYYLLALAVFLFAAEIVYFRIADRFNIIDKPNERSSHTQITIRGGGIVFLIAGIATALYSGFQLPWFWLGFALISLVSFVDDIQTLSSRIRLPIHFIAVMLLIYQGLHNDGLLWIWLASLVLVTGIINAYNFMDGINGITASYSLVALIALFILNAEYAFASGTFILTFIIADFVFAFFNFRRKAKCFAGDVGSVSIAFVIVFLLFQLIIETQNIFFILLLAVYGVDSVLTIVYRLFKRENIFEAHRTHVYQWLVKPGPFSHLQISSLYAIVQAIISAGVIWLAGFNSTSQVLYAISVLVALALVYIITKARYSRKYDLV